MFWLVLFSRLIFYKEEELPEPTSLPSMTILVVFKNAIQDLKSSIAGLKQQDIKPRHILLVDDFSTDGGLELANTFCKPEIDIHKAVVNGNGKKLALQEGLQLLETDAVLLTDIDCLPASEAWARIVQNKFQKSIEIVLGYSPVKKDRGFLNLFSKFETWMTGVQYMSYALAGMPYMGVGRNLAYRLSTVSGFTPDTSIASGDDDLFVSAKATGENTAICLDPDSFVFTRSEARVSDYIKQKRRHISTSYYYAPLHKVLLTLFAMSQMLIFPLFFVLMYSIGLSPILIVSTVAYVCIKWGIAFPLMKRFDERSLFLWFPIMDVILSIYYWLMALLSVKPLKTWS